MTSWLAIWRTPRCFSNSGIDMADDSRFGRTGQSRVNQQNTCAIPPFDLGVDLVLSKRPKRYIGLSGLEKAFLGFFESNQRRDSIITHHSDSSESTSNFMEP